MYKDEAIEKALSWANQQGYSFSKEALDAYCAQTGCEWTDDPMYNYVTFWDKPESE